MICIHFYLNLLEIAACQICLMLPQLDSDAIFASQVVCYQSQYPATYNIKCCLHPTRMLLPNLNYYRLLLEPSNSAFSCMGWSRFEHWQRKQSVQGFASKISDEIAERWAVIDPNLRKYPVSGGAESNTILMKVVFLLWGLHRESKLCMFSDYQKRYIHANILIIMDGGRGEAVLTVRQLAAVDCHDVSTVDPLLCASEHMNLRRKGISNAISWLWSSIWLSLDYSLIGDPFGRPTPLFCYVYVRDENRKYLCNSITCWLCRNNISPTSYWCRYCWCR